MRRVLKVIVEAPGQDEGILSGGSFFSPESEDVLEITITVTHIVEDRVLAPQLTAMTHSRWDKLLSEVRQLLQD